MKVHLKYDVDFDGDLDPVQVRIQQTDSSLDFNVTTKADPSKNQTFSVALNKVTGDTTYAATRLSAGDQSSDFQMVIVVSSGTEKPNRIPIKFNLADFFPANPRHSEHPKNPSQIVSQQIDHAIVENSGVLKILKEFNIMDPE